jgi:hypothetical protein
MTENFPKLIIATVNGTGAVYDQKTSKFFVSKREESIAGHMGITWSLLKVRKGKYNQVHGGSQVEACWPREHVSALRPF